MTRDGMPYPARGEGQIRLHRRPVLGDYAVVIFAGLLLALANLAPAQAVEPGEMLKDPALEARARQVSEGLRCLVCQNESIDESHADLARDIRLLVRQRLLAGDSNKQVMSYLVDRYGQFILLKPPLETQTLLLWGTPLIVLVLGGIGIAFALRGRSTPTRDPARPLTEAEQRRLHDLLDGRPT